MVGLDRGAELSLSLGLAGARRAKAGPVHGCMGLQGEGLGLGHGLGTRAGAPSLDWAQGRGWPWAATGPEDRLGLGPGPGLCPARGWGQGRLAAVWGRGWTRYWCWAKEHA